MSSGIILPGGKEVPVKKAEDTPEYDSLTDEQKAALDEMAEDINPEDVYPKVEFAYVVIKQSDGSYGIAFDIASAKVSPRTTASEEDVLAANAVVDATIRAQITAAAVQASMMQQAAMMQRAAQEQALRSQLKI